MRDIYTVNCTVYNVYCTFYSVQCTGGVLSGYSALSTPPSNTYLLLK